MLLLPLQVCAGIIIDKNKFLLCQRKEEKHKGAWEFPGGKVEAHESHQDALKRELKEELGISCEIGPHFQSVLFKYEKNKQLNLHCYIINSFSGKIHCHTHTQAVWVTAEEAPFYKLLPADLPVMEKLIRQKKSR